jgi:hypothetical protein
VLGFKFSQGLAADNRQDVQGQERAEIQKQIDGLLGNETKYEIYEFE